MALNEATIRAWRLSIEACVEAGGVPLGHFNWPMVLGEALDALEAEREVVAREVTAQAEWLRSTGEDEWLGDIWADVAAFIRQGPPTRSGPHSEE